MKPEIPDPVVILSGQPVIAQGRRQHIYEHPGDPTSLIKLPMPGSYDAKGNLIERRRFDRFRRATAFRDFLREFREYLELKARHQSPGTPLPLCAVRGIVETDLGLGLVYERIGDADGALAPTLKTLIRRKRIEPHHLEEIEVLFRQLMDNHVVVSNFNLDNIVYQAGRGGAGRFVYIDSFGSKEFIPVRRWFRSRNDRKIRAIRASCIEKMSRARRAGAVSSQSVPDDSAAPSPARKRSHNP